MSETVRLEVEAVKRDSGKALLVVVDGVEAWIPKSQIHDDSEVFDAEENATGALVIPLWLAEEKGLA